MVAFPVDDLAKVAVVSWRWDIDAVDHPSRNLYSAVLYAKKAKLRYLFIDVISIDQNLKGDALLEQVRLFTDLYRTIPVITAYDKPNCDLLSSMRRPWIASEITAFKHNPTSIINLRHDPRRQPHVEYVPPTHMEAAHLSGPDKAVIGLDRHHGFRGRAVLIWKAAIVTSILQLMFGMNQMQNVFDLKYIMPIHAPILVAAEKQLQKDDYLLTAALLAQSDIYWPDPDMDEVSIKQGTVELSSSNFSVYNVERVIDPGNKVVKYLKLGRFPWKDLDHMFNVSKNKGHATCSDRAAGSGLRAQLIESARSEMQEYVYGELMPESKQVDGGKVTHTVSLGSDPTSIMGYFFTVSGEDRTFFKALPCIKRVCDTLGVDWENYKAFRHNQAKTPHSESTDAEIVPVIEVHFVDLSRGESRRAERLNFQPQARIGRRPSE